MGYDNLIFLDKPINANLKCAICFNICKDATTACSAGHTFCAECLQRCTATNTAGNNKCPTCRADRISIANRPLRGMIHALRVRCGEGGSEEEEGSVQHVKKKSRTDETSSGGDDAAALDNDKNINSSGCNWEGTLGDWRDTHQNECPFVLVPCPDKCGKQVRRMDMEEHKTTECPMRKVECGLCHAMIKNGDMERHKRYKCPKKMVQCDFCKKEMTREELGEYGSKPKERFDAHPILHDERTRMTGHYAVCPKMLLWCEFDCCMSQFKREDAAKHHAKNAQRHAAIVNEQIENLENWDRVRMSWIIPRRKLVSRNTASLRSKVLSGVTQYELYLTLHLRGPEDPIKVALCSDSMSCCPTKNYTTLKGFEFTVNENENPFFARTYAIADFKEEIKVPFEDGERGVFKFSSKLKKEIYPDSEDEDQDPEPVDDFTLSDMFEYMNMRGHNSDGVMISALFYIRKYRDVYLSCDDDE